jgi:hypothetical protein
MRLLYAQTENAPSMQRKSSLWCQLCDVDAHLHGFFNVKIYKSARVVSITSTAGSIWVPSPHSFQLVIVTLMGPGLRSRAACHLTRRVGNKAVPVHYSCSLASHHVVVFPAIPAPAPLPVPRANFCIIIALRAAFRRHWHKLTLLKHTRTGPTEGTNILPAASILAIIPCQLLVVLP